MAPRFRRLLLQAVEHAQGELSLGTPRLSEGKGMFRMYVAMALDHMRTEPDDGITIMIAILRRVP